MKIIDAYRLVYNKPKIWDYYNKRSFAKFPCTQAEQIYFIHKYIENSGKNRDNPLLLNLNSIKDKAGHTISTFFLGILFYENNSEIKKAIDDKIKILEKKNPEIKVSFSFLWFLISLFHDLGFYSIEEQKPRTINSLEELKEKYEIKNHIKSPHGIPIELFEDYKKYFKYKIHHFDKIDHGIAAALILYDNLVKTYYYLKPINQNKDSFEYNGLYWSNKTFGIFRLISSVILAHNIFYAKEGVDDYVDCYKDVNIGLNKLIIPKNEKPRIYLKKHPFLYLFCLIDSIDSFKINEAEPENTEIHFVNSSIKFVFQNDLNTKRGESLNKIPNWLNVDVSFKNKELILKNFR